MPQKHLKDMTTVLNKINTGNKMIYIMGDFNIDFISKDVLLHRRLLIYNILTNCKNYDQFIYFSYRYQ